MVTHLNDCLHTDEHSVGLPSFRSSSAFTSLKATCESPEENVRRLLTDTAGMSTRDGEGVLDRLCEATRVDADQTAQCESVLNVLLVRQHVSTLTRLHSVSLNVRSCRPSNSVKASGIKMLLKKNSCETMKNDILKHHI